MSEEQYAQICSLGLHDQLTKEHYQENDEVLFITEFIGQDGNVLKNVRAIVKYLKSRYPDFRGNCYGYRSAMSKQSHYKHQ